MVDYKTLLHQGFIKYFNTLEATGYVNDQVVFQMVLLQFLIDFIKQSRCYIEVEDWQYIQKTIQCLFKSSCYLSYDALHTIAPEYIGTTCTLELYDENPIEVCAINN